MKPESGEGHQHAAECDRAARNPDVPALGEDRQGTHDERHLEKNLGKVEAVGKALVPVAIALVLPSLILDGLAFLLVSGVSRASSAPTSYTVRRMVFAW
jgi:hypothetical protein